MRISPDKSQSTAHSTLETEVVADTDKARAIEQLRIQVQSGSYDVSAETVAQALIDAHIKD